jgi:hypothetical protein
MNAISQVCPATDYTVAAEIEAIAWKLMEGDIEQGSDALQLAADYADMATDTYEDQAGMTFGATHQNIVRLVRQSLTARIKMEISNRDFTFEVEYASRQRSGRIDANGCGDVPVW